MKLGKCKFYKVGLKECNEMILCEYHSSEDSGCDMVLIHYFIHRRKNTMELTLSGFYDHQIDTIEDLPDGMLL